MSRKIVQIAVVPAVVFPDGSWDNPVVYALCDDGTAFRAFLNGSGEPDEWRQLPPIPQESESENG